MHQNPAKLPMIDSLTIILPSPMVSQHTEVSGVITTWSQDNPQTTLAYKPVDVNEVTLTLIANTQHSTLSTASVLALAYQNPSHLHYRVTPL